MRLSNKLIRRKKLNLQDNLGTPAIATRADVDAISTDYYLYTISSYLFYNPHRSYNLMFLDVNQFPTKPMKQDVHETPLVQDMHDACGL